MVMALVSAAMIGRRTFVGRRHARSPADDYSASSAPNFSHFPSFQAYSYMLLFDGQNGADTLHNVGKDLE